MSEIRNNHNALESSSDSRHSGLHNYTMHQDMMIKNKGAHRSTTMDGIRPLKRHTRDYDYYSLEKLSAAKITRFKRQPYSHKTFS